MWERGQINDFNVKNAASELIPEADRPSGVEVNAGAHGNLALPCSESLQPRCSLPAPDSTPRSRLGLSDTITTCPTHPDQLRVQILRCLGGELYELNNREDERREKLEQN